MTRHCLLSLLLGALLVAACTGGQAPTPAPTPTVPSEASPEPVNLVVVVHPWIPREEFEDNIKEYERQNPGVTIEQLEVDVSEAYIPALQRLINAGTQMDVILMLGDSYTVAVESDQIMLDITDRVTYYDRFDEDQFYAGFYDVDGRRYGVPAAFGHFATLMYNEALLSDFGIARFPTTYDELKAIAPTLREAGVVPVAGFGQIWNFYAVMTLHMTFDQMTGNRSVEVIRDTLADRMKFTDRVYQETWACALQYFEDELFQVDPGPQGALWLGLDEATAAALLPSRRVASAWNGSWALPDLKEAAAQSDGSFALGLGLPPRCPSAPVDAAYRAVTYLPEIWSVYKGSTHVDEALALIDFLSSDDVATGWMEAAAVPFTTNRNATPPAADQIDQVGIELFEGGVIDATWLLGIDLSQEYAQQFQRVAMGEQTIDEGLAAVEAWKQANKD